MFDNFRFTDNSRKALENAQKEAKDMGFNYVGTEHLLLGILGVEECVAAALLKKMGVKSEEVRQRVIKLTGKGDFVFAGEMQLTPRTKNVIENTNRISRQMGHDFVGTEHILLTLIHEQHSVATRVLLELNVDLNRLKEALLNALGVSASAKKGQEGAQPGGVPGGAQGSETLEKFTRDLTQAARNGELDPVIGREKEIERVIQILSRRTKNNPVLIG